MQSTELQTKPEQISEFGRDFIAGLRHQPRQISPKWFYDVAGSTLFEQICETPEYYPTRTELGLIERYASEMADFIGSGAEVVEFGAGATQKIRILLDALDSPARFIPVDISGEHLLNAAKGLQRDYPSLDVKPVVADFTKPMQLPVAVGKRVGFFPGSSIGNFEPADAQRLLSRMADMLDGGGLLIGIDLVKDPASLHSAYNDAKGVTAAFNLNLLARANRELEGNIDVANFAHAAFYNPPRHRIEMHLMSRVDQEFSVAGETFFLAEGDSIHTEYSYKYTVESFRKLASEAGFTPKKVWVDDAKSFSIHWLAL